MTHTTSSCPCGSGNPYTACCRPFHEGMLPSTALELMRSRYSAYAHNLPHYIITTTHPLGPEYCPDHTQWEEALSQSCSASTYHQLEILDFQESLPFATVTFVVSMNKKNEEITFTERSLFEKVGEQWLYRSGQLSAGRAPQLVSHHPLKVLSLAYYGDAVLSERAQPVKDINDELKTLVEAMIETMDLCDGMGLAAPQIHQGIQLFVVRPVIEVNGNYELGSPEAVINPKMTAKSEKQWKAPEGCLSLPGISAEVERPQAIMIEYTTITGEKTSKKLSGWTARIMMHETDHLNGVLFIDHLEAEERKQWQPQLDHIVKIQSYLRTCSESF